MLLLDEKHNIHDFLLHGSHRDIHTLLRSAYLNVLLWYELLHFRDFFRHLRHWHFEDDVLHDALDDFFHDLRYGNLDHDVFHRSDTLVEMVKATSTSLSIWAITVVSRRAPSSSSASSSQHCGDGAVTAMATDCGSSTSQQRFHQGQPPHGDGLPVWFSTCGSPW